LRGLCQNGLCAGKKKLTDITANHYLEVFKLNIGADSISLAMDGAGLFRRPQMAPEDWVNKIYICLFRFTVIVFGFCNRTGDDQAPPASAHAVCQPLSFAKEDDFAGFSIFQFEFCKKIVFVF
jgi:hypothetical protein